MTSSVNEMLSADGPAILYQVFGRVRRIQFENNNDLELFMGVVGEMFCCNGMIGIAVSRNGVPPVFAENPDQSARSRSGINIIVIKNEGKNVS